MDKKEQAIWIKYIIQNFCFDLIKSLLYQLFSLPSHIFFLYFLVKWGIVSLNVLLIFPTELLSQLLVAFGPSQVFCTKNPLEMCESCEFFIPSVWTDPLLRVPRAGGCLCVEPLDLVDSGRKCLVQRKLWEKLVVNQISFCDNSCAFKPWLYVCALPFPLCYWNSCNIQASMEILRKSKYKPPHKKPKHKPTKNMSCNFFLVSLHLSWSLPQNNQLYIATGTGQFLWLFFKFKNKEPKMNCQEVFVGVFCWFFYNICCCLLHLHLLLTHVFLSSLILLKAGMLSLRGMKGVFLLMLLSHSKKLSFEASLVTHTDYKNMISKVVLWVLLYEMEKEPGAKRCSFSQRNQ